MEKGPSFFERLTFDPKLASSWISRYFSSTRTILLIVFTISAMGMVTFFALPKELNPSIEIPIVFVATPYPGAGPEEVETLVTIPLEDALLGLSGVTKVSSSSQEGISSISVEFQSGSDPQAAKTEVQNTVESVADLPEEVSTPRTQVLDFQEQPVLTFLISAQGNPANLSRFSYELKQRLDDLSTVEKIETRYGTESEVSIFFTPTILRENNLNLGVLSQVIGSALRNFPSGTLSSNDTTLALTQDSLVKKVDDLRDLPLSFNGTVRPLGEVAIVREESTPNTARAFYADNTTSQAPAVFFSVYQREGIDATKAVESIEKAIHDFQNDYSEGDAFVYESLFNGAEEIRKSFNQLFRDFLITFSLVFIVLLIFFGVRQSVIASLAIPLTFLGVFLVMQATGISVNFIALFSLLLALGILVDNAIVIISAMASYDRTGKFSPEETALLVFRDFRTVIFTTTITTVWAFLPLLLATGIIGEFIKPIPILVSSALAISAAIALFIVPPLMAVLMRGQFPRRVILFSYGIVFLLGSVGLAMLIPAGPAKPILFVGTLFLLLVLIFTMRALWNRFLISLNTKVRFRKPARHGLVDFTMLSHRYARTIESILHSKSARRRTFAMLIIFSLFSYALVPTGLVVNEFFPEDDLELVYAHLELAEGTTREKAEEAVPPLLDKLRVFPDTRFVFAELGAAPPTDSMVSTGTGFHSILFTLVLSPKEDRKHSSTEVVAALNNTFKNYDQGTFSASQLSGGPPAGADIELKIIGEDLNTLEQYAQNIEGYLKNAPGITHTNLSIEGGQNKVVFTPRKEELSKRNISEIEFATLLRALGSGITVKENARFISDYAGEVERDVVLRVGEPGGRLGTSEMLSTLSSAEIGGGVSLLSLGDFRLEPNPTLITREDGKRTLSVRAGVAEGYSISTANADLEKYADTLNLPIGYTWQTGGVNEENDKSVRSILMAMLLSAVLIFGTMAVQFNSFRQAIAVLLVIPLAVSGVFVIFGLFGIPLSFPALIGVLALFGIVVNNSIIMVDKINKNMHSGLPLIQAISEGAATRLEPILLTAFTTIIGLIPITLSDPIWQGLGGAIIAGLLFSGIAKLFFLPLIYYAFFGPKEEKSSVQL